MTARVAASSPRREASDDRWTFAVAPRGARLGNEPNSKRCGMIGGPHPLKPEGAWENGEEICVSVAVSSTPELYAMIDAGLAGKVEQPNFVSDALCLIYEVLDLIDDQPSDADHLAFYVRRLAIHVLPHLSLDNANYLAERLR
jgi:hypothetical protein